MNTALDFVNRARHAWTEFREPSKFDNSAPAQQAHAENGESRYEHPEIIQTNSQLTDFRLLVGILQDKSFTSKHGFQMNRRPQASLADRPSPNLGIYATVCDCEIKAKRNYKSASRLINFCYGLQIIVAAALTALGAAAASNKAVTAFGAINTCIAGFLTYLRGSGLPHRIKYFQHEWAKIRECIEQRERDFTFPNSGLSVAEEVEKIRKMYEELRQDIENNRPDRFVSSGTLARAQPQAISLARPQPSFSTMSKHWNEKETEASTAIDRARGTASGLFSNARGMKDMLEDKLKELKELEHEIVSSGKHMAEEKKKSVVEQVQSTARDIEHVGEKLEHDAKAALDERYTEGRDQVGNAIVRTQDGAHAAIERTQDGAHAAVARQGDAVRDSVGSRGDETAPK